MCKIAIITQHNPDQLQQLVLSLWSAMASTERDGYGAAWVQPNGRIGFVKSSNPRGVTPLPDFFKSFCAGQWSKSDGGAMLVHGRTATCGVNAENTHPMLLGDSALVHNGVVTSKKYHNTESTCDSELLLHAFRQGGIDEVAKEVSGYYAFEIGRAHV